MAEMASKMRQPLQEIKSDNHPEQKTVFDYVKEHTEALMKEVIDQAADACDDLRREFEASIAEIRESGEDIFKIGRSTGKLFRLHGVSLKRDKEVSTTHAKIETRGSLVFLTDLQSTNGSSINGEEIEPDDPQELHTDDVICVGKTQLSVSIAYVPLDDAVVESTSITPEPESAS